MKDSEKFAHSSRAADGRAPILSLRSCFTTLCSIGSRGSPARDVGGRKAPHRLVAQYGVFQNFVERRSDVHVAIGERRAVVQDEFRGARARLLNLFIQPDFLPVLYAGGLALHEVAAHGEFGVGKV